MKTLLTMATAIILTCGAGFANDQAVQKSTAEKTGDATENALEKAGEGTEKGLKKAGEGAGEGVEQAAKGVAKAGKETGKALEKAGEAVSDFFTDENGVQDKDKVMAAQRALQSKGYYSGPIDGIAGPKTRAGLREYQGDSNLSVTGKLDEPTAKKLGLSD